uniref:Uncharacterized protein n=1 Tax=Kwoniella dejecticola CBS 10117 TaxID=1296121 RepID=A0A1A6AEI1_9TREE|nr:uncharacterized protein I303_00298 [Kwoniella dejecticola CBS 10117]OBR88481.1 hypothetical protein I303_00298 [Kwoniella dejecticola CBS 10117]
MSVIQPLEGPDAFSLAYMSGPFFLGFTLECFGMGIVLILSINYFLTLGFEPKSPHESSRRLGVSLVGISLALNLAQTVVDLIRGWDMFATNFTNIKGFLTSSPLFFVSPFLGLIPSTLTQLFLLRRITLFISSLDLLWPKLAHPLVKYTFSAAMGFAIMSSFVTGTISSVLVWKSGNLVTLGLQGKTDFAKAEQTWLATSAGVDTVLALVLSIELWWARQKLGMQGGVMREIVTRLILPKVYNITLILSLSVPHSTEVAPNPSHIFSLPTILDTQPAPPDLPQRTSSRELRDSHLRLRLKHSSHRKDESGDVNEKADRNWFSWSVGAIPSSSQSRKRNSTAEYKPQRYTYSETRSQDRRPSDPNSICPLLQQGETPSAESYRNSYGFSRSPMTMTMMSDHLVLPSPPPSSMTAHRHGSLSSGSAMTYRQPFSSDMPTPKQTHGFSYPQHTTKTTSDLIPASRDRPSSSWQEAEAPSSSGMMSFMDILGEQPGPSPSKYPKPSIPI